MPACRQYRFFSHQISRQSGTQALLRNLLELVIRPPAD
jgi:hypothetical protein